MWRRQFCLDQQTEPCNLQELSSTKTLNPQAALVLSEQRCFLFRAHNYSLSGTAPSSPPPFSRARRSRGYKAFMPVCGELVGRLRASHSPIDLADPRVGPYTHPPSASALRSRGPGRLRTEGRRHHRHEGAPTEKPASAGGLRSSDLPLWRVVKFLPQCQAPMAWPARPVPRPGSRRGLPARTPRP